VIVILLGSEGGSHVGSVKISKAKWHKDDARGGAWIFKQGGRKLSMRWSDFPGFHCDREVWDFCGVEMRQMTLNCWICV